MGGLDKYQAFEALKAKGWTDDPARGKYMLRPPPQLLEQLAAMSFHVYDARDLQAFVKEPSSDGNR